MHNKLYKCCAVGKTQQIVITYCFSGKCTTNYNMLVFRWEKHTTTTCLCSGGKNTQAKIKKHAWDQVGKTHNYNMLGFRWEKQTI